MKVPAATAVPITPATFGPIACIRRKFVGSASEPTFWDTRAAIGTADTPAEPINGLTLPPVTLHMSLPKITPAAVPNANAISPRITILIVVTFKNALSTCCSANGKTENDYNDVHKSVGSCLL